MWAWLFPVKRNLGIKPGIFISGSNLKPPFRRQQEEGPHRRAPVAQMPDMQRHEKICGVRVLTPPDKPPGLLADRRDSDSMDWQCAVPHVARNADFQLVSAGDGVNAELITEFLLTLSDLVTHGLTSQGVASVVWRMRARTAAAAETARTIRLFGFLRGSLGDETGRGAKGSVSCYDFRHIDQTLARTLFGCSMIRLLTPLWPGKSSETNCCIRGSGERGDNSQQMQS